MELTMSSPTMNNTQALNHLFNLAKKGPKAYHSGYADTVAYSNALKAYFAGVDINRYMKINARRENTELFEQRVDITAEVNSAFGMMLEKPFAKIQRSNWKEFVSVGNDNTGKAAIAFKKNILDKFGTKGLFPYTFERLRYWNIYDPNCFVVVEFKPFDSAVEQARPYPFEVTAEMAVDFRYMQADLLYLCCLQHMQKEDKGTEVEVKRFTMYRPQWSVGLQQLTSDEAQAALKLTMPPKLDAPFSGDVVDGDLVNIGGTIYRAIIPTVPHGYEKTPAVRTGYIDNPKDNGTTKLSIFHAALPYAKKIVKINSEVDLVSSLVASPIPMRYSDRCTARGCHGGVLTDNTECMVCHGTGKKKRPTSVQEEIELPFPDSKEDVVVGLTEMFAYIHFPPEGAALLISLLDKWLERGNLSVFGSELTTKSEVAQTARFHSRAEQGVNDALYPYGTHISAVCGELSRIIAAAAKVAGGFAKPIIPGNLRFETVFDLFDELKAARDAGASNDACAILQLRILEIMMQDDPEALKRARVDDRLNAFRGMTEAQIMVALNNPLVSDDKKFFYLNKSEVMEMILYDKPNFYELPAPDQRKIVSDKVKELRGDMTTAATVPQFNQPGPARASQDQPANQN